MTVDRVFLFSTIRTIRPAPRTRPESSRRLPKWRGGSRCLSSRTRSTGGCITRADMCPSRGSIPRALSSAPASRNGVGQEVGAWARLRFHPTWTGWLMPWHQWRARRTRLSALQSSMLLFAPLRAETRSKRTCDTPDEYCLLPGGSPPESWGKRACAFMRHRAPSTCLSTFRRFETNSPSVESATALLCVSAYSTTPVWQSSPGLPSPGLKRS